MGRDQYSSMDNQNEAANADSSKAGRLLLVLGLLLIVAVAAMWYLQNNPVRGWDFQMNLWIPSRLLIDGHSPYRVELLHDIGNAVWMPTIIGFGFPLGWFSYPTASNLWFLLNLVALLAIIALIAIRQKPSAVLLAVVAVMVVTFPLSLTNLRLGQITIIITLFFLAIAFLKDRLPLPVVALMIVLALSKPQLGILVVPGLLLAYYREDGPRRAFTLLGMMALWTAILIVPLFFGSANWIADFVAALRKNPSYLHPSLWTVIPSWVGSTGLWFWGGAVVVLGVISLRLWLTRGREEAILWSLAMTPLLTPYVWNWDFVMLLPLFASSMMGAKNRLQQAILIIGYLICWIMIWQILNSDPSNVNYWWIPLYMILLVLGSSVASHIYEKRSPRRSLQKEQASPPGL
jgi:hypothetical protein